MTRYLHERKNWPRFRFSHKRLAARLASVRYRQGRLIGRMESLGPALRAEATRLTLTEDVLRPGEADIDAADMRAEPLTIARLFAWHAALFAEPRQARGVVGAWRAGGPVPASADPLDRAHIPPPAAERLDREMRGFLEWSNAASPLDPVLNAGVAHLWFATLRPFDGGNFRIACALTDRALARSEQGGERFYSLSAQMRVEQDAYAAALAAAQTGDLDITPWLAWFLGCLDRALDAAELRLAPVLRKVRFWGAHAGDAFTARQRAMLDRLLDGVEGRLTSSRWAGLTACSQDTALREIDDLLRRGILAKDAAGGRSTRYALAETA